jgi:thiamine pyrophosphate-dependent acetolactate synthase large subunit-like protein
LKVKAVNGLVKILKQEGVKFVSTFPTSHINNAIGEEGDISLFMVRDERYAVAVADAYSRLMDGKAFGVCTVMGGMNAAGVEMAYGAMAQAYEDSVPLLCLTEGVPMGVIGRERYSIRDGLKSVTKWTGYVNRADRLPEYMRRAYTHLRTGRPSPVLLEVPRELGEYDSSEHTYHPVKGWRSMGDPADVRTVIKALREAPNTLLYVGQGVFSADACEELLNFAELAQIPVLTTLKAKSAFPENHELSLGVRGEPAKRFLQKADIVLAIGVGFTPSGFMHSIPDAKRKKIIQCTINESDLNNDYSVDMAILGDAKLVLGQLIAELEKQGTPKRDDELLKSIEDAKMAMMEKYTPLMESNEKPINPYRVYKELSDVIDKKNSFVTHESGNTRDQLSTVYQAIIPHGFMGWGNVTTLGYGLGASMGAKLAFPQRQVVSVTGDAGVGYQMGNWETLTRYNMGITTIHINNDGFGGYGPGFWGKGHDPYTYELLNHEKQSTAKVAEALGMEAERVEDPDELSTSLKHALKTNASGKPYFIEAICSKYPVYPSWVRA